MGAVGLIPTVISVLAGIVVLIMIMVGAEGRPRLFGLLGTTLVMVSALLAVLPGLVLGELMDQVAADDVLPWLSAYGIVRILFTGSGLILLAVALTLVSKDPGPRANV